MPIALNEDIAGRLDEVARILNEQGANRFRVQAYHRAATALRPLAKPVSEIFAAEGLEGLEKLPGVGESNWYCSPQFQMEGWLCPALYRYFKEAPAQIYVKAEPNGGESNHPTQDKFELFHETMGMKKGS